MSHKWPVMSVGCDSIWIHWRFPGLIINSTNIAALVRGNYSSDRVGTFSLGEEGCIGPVQMIITPVFFFSETKIGIRGY